MKLHSPKNQLGKPLVALNETGKIDTSLIDVKDTLTPTADGEIVSGKATAEWVKEQNYASDKELESLEYRVISQEDSTINLQEQINALDTKTDSIDVRVKALENGDGGQSDGELLVDQEFDKESTHAQSGIAIEGRIKEFGEQIDGTYAKKGDIPELDPEVSNKLAGLEGKVGDMENRLDSLQIPSIEGLATEEYVDEQIKGIEHPALPENLVTDEKLAEKGFATESYVDEKISEIDIPKVPEDIVTEESLAGKNFATKTFVEERIQEIPELPQDIVTEGTLEAKGFATESFVESKIQGIEMPEVPEHIVTEEILSEKGFATETYVGEEIAKIEIPEIPQDIVTEEALDSKGFATESFVESKIEELNIPELPEGIVTEETLAAKNLATQEYVDEKIGEIETPTLPENVVTEETLSEKGFVTSSEVESIVDEKLEGFEGGEGGSCNCEPVDIGAIRDTLYGSLQLIDPEASFEGGTTTPFTGINITPALNHAPTRLKSFVINNVQNAATLTTPLQARCEGILSNEVYSWKEGDDIEFIFTKEIDTSQLSSLQIIWVEDPNHAEEDKVPHVFYDANRTTPGNWFRICAVGDENHVNSWNTSYRYSPANISFRYGSLFDTLDEHGAKIDTLESGAEQTAQDIQDLQGRVETLEAKDCVTHDEISGLATSEDLSGIRNDITNLQSVKADKSELNKFVTNESLRNGISTQALTVTGNQQQFGGVSQANLDLGYKASLTATATTTGNISLGGESTIYSNSNHSGNIQAGSILTVETDAQIQGNLFAGMSAKINGGNFSGSTITGRLATISGGNFNGVVDVGDTSTISGGTFNSNVNLAYGATLTGGSFYGNVFGGGYTNVAGLTETRNFWAIASLKNSVDLKTQIEKRLGVIFVGTGATDPILTPSKVSQLLLPNDKNFALKVCGWERWESDFNVVDANGVEIIKNGVLTVTGNSSEGIDEEELNRILATKGYLTSTDLENYVTSDQLDNYVTTEAAGSFVTSEQIANFVTNEQVVNLVEEHTQNVVTTETVESIVSEKISTTVDSVVDRKLENKLFAYITFEDFTNQTQDFVSESELEGYAKKSDIPSTDSFATKTELEEVKGSIPTDYVSSSELETYATKESVLSVEAKTSNLESKLESKADSSELETLATKEELGALDRRVEALESKECVTSESLADVLIEYAKTEDFQDVVTSTSLSQTLESYVTEEELESRIESSVEEKLGDVENSISELDEKFATKEELSAITPLVYGSFGFPNTTSGNYNLLVAILGDNYNPKNYGKLHSISIQLGSDIPANQNGHSTNGNCWMYIGKWDEEANVITEILEVSTNSVVLASNEIATWEFDSEVDYSDTDKICFCLHTSNDKTPENINQNQALLRCKVGPTSGEDSYVWNITGAKGNFLPAFMARCEVFEGGQIQVVDSIEEHNHGCVTSNAVYKELAKPERTYPTEHRNKVQEIVTTGFQFGSRDVFQGSNSYPLTDAFFANAVLPTADIANWVNDTFAKKSEAGNVDTSNLVTKATFNGHIGDYDTHWAAGEKSELYSDIDTLQETVLLLQSSVTQLQNEIKSLKAENATLRTYVDENFIKGAVVDERPSEEEAKDGYTYFVKPSQS